MTQQFGNQHTEIKLDAIEKYLAAYTTALSKQNFELIYFDAFAGTGEVDITGKDTKLPEYVQMELMDEDLSNLYAGDLDKFTDGSAKRALQIPRKFDKYFFIEKKKKKFYQLQKLKDEFPNLSTSIACINGDANLELKKFCQQTNWVKTRAVVFLDPFGSQVDFDTIKLIASTEAIDLWYLFPSFLSVYRQISNLGKMTSEQESSINRIIGTEAWKDKWTSSEIVPDLFGEENVSKKQVEINDITEFMIARMKKEFKGGVLDTWLPLGLNGSHWYSLLFAWANPSPKAKLAANLANHVMTRK